MEHAISKINLSCFPNGVLESVVKAIAQAFGGVPASLYPPPHTRGAMWCYVCRQIGIFTTWKTTEAVTPGSLPSVIPLCVCCVFI